MLLSRECPYRVGCSLLSSYDVVLTVAGTDAASTTASQPPIKSRSILNITIFSVLGALLLISASFILFVVILYIRRKNRAYRRDNVDLNRSLGNPLYDDGK